MERFLTIYQKPKKQPVSRKVRVREQYHRAVAKGIRPKRYTKYKDMTPEQYKQHTKKCNESRMRRYHNDPAYKRKVNRERVKMSLRQRQRAAGKTKWCKTCDTHQPFCDFEKRGGEGPDKDTLRYECKKCRKRRNAEAYQRRKNDNT